MWTRGYRFKTPIAKEVFSLAVLFSGKARKSLLFLVCCCGRFCSCLFTILRRDVVCRMKWRRLRPYSPLSSAYIVAELLYKVDKSSPPLFDEKGFLLNPLIKELAGNWRLCPLHPTLVTWPPLATFGDFRDQLPHGEIATLPKSAYFGGESASWGRGDGLGCHLSYPPPPHRGFLFFASCCYLFLLMQPFFFMLTQPSWDGYF